MKDARSQRVAPHRDVLGCPLRDLVQILRIVPGRLRSTDAAREEHVERIVQHMGSSVVEATAAGRWWNKAVFPRLLRGFTALHCRVATIKSRPILLNHFFNNSAGKPETFPRKQRYQQQANTTGGSLPATLMSFLALLSTRPHLLNMPSRAPHMRIYIFSAPLINANNSWLTRARESSLSRAATAAASKPKTSTALRKQKTHATPP